MTDIRTFIGAWQRRALVELVASALVAAPVLVFAQTARAQQEVTVVESAPIANLFKRADEGRTQHNWKLVCDSLQRVIDDPLGGLVETGDGLYESSRRQAHKKLADMGPDGRRAYRILHDGEAKALFERGRAEHSLPLLREVVDRYFLTSYGDDAADLAASWHIDEAAPATAAALLRDLVEIYPDSDLPQWLPLARLGMAYGLMGDAASYERALAAASAASGGDRDATSRIDAVRQLAGLTLHAAGAVRSGDWPMLMGGGTCDGRMEPVYPTFLETSHWRLPLPTSRSDSWTDVVLPQAGPARRLLVDYPILADGVLFAQGDAGLAAVDAERFELLWTAPYSHERLGDGGVRRRGLAPANDFRELESELLDDQIGGMLSVAHGLVFNIEEPSPVSMPSPNGVTIVVGGQLRRFNEFAASVGNALVARELRGDGRIRWQKAPGNDPADFLAGAQFLGVPVEAGQYLLAPVRLRSELYAVVLDAGDGHLIKSILLGSLSGQNGMADAAQTGAYICVVDDNAYILLNREAVFAVNLADGTLRWASRYETVSSGFVEEDWRQLRIAPPEGLIRSGSWIGNPPVAAGPYLMVAPSDAERLIALDRVTGERKWTLPRGSFLYIVAADHQFVWVAGASAAKVDLTNGRTIWDVPMGIPTGRGVLSGDRLLFPTMAGLMVLDAGDGKHIEEIHLPPEQPPLGNILCRGGSMFSVDSRELRKFPDLEQSYPRTLAEHEQDPADPGVAIRLAWIELFKKRPEAAVAALENVRIETDERGQRRREDVAHLRVQAFVAIANAAETPAEQSIAAAGQAVQAARSPDDELVAKLTLAEHLTRAQRAAEAYRALLELALSPGSDGMATEGDGLTRSARAIVADRMRRVADSLSVSDRQQMRELTRAWFEEASAHLDSEEGRREAADRLMRLTEAAPWGGWGQRAALALGRNAAARRRFEQAECYFRMADDPRGEVAPRVEALIELADMYMLPGQILPLMAESSLGKAEQLCVAAGGNDALPVEVINELSQLSGRIQGCRNRIPADVLQADREGIEAAKVRMFANKPWPQDLSYSRLIAFPDRRPECLAQGFLALVDFNRIECRSVSDAHLLWASEVRLLDELDEETVADFVNFTDRSPPLDRTPTRRAAYDGQTLFIATPTGIHAVGMATGRRLWSRELEAAASNPTVAGLDYHLSADRNLLAFMESPSALAVARALDGKALWKRKVSEQLAATLKLAGDYVLMADNDRQRITVFRASDGVELQHFAFEQPDADQEPVTFAYCGDMICGPVAGGVAGYGISDGRRLWKVEQRETVTEIVKTDCGKLVIGTMGGGVSVVEPSDGHVLMSDTLPIGRGGIVGADIVDDRTLVVLGRESASTESPPELAGVDLETGRIDWVHKDFEQTLIRPEYLQLSKHVVPVLYQPVLRRRQSGDPVRDGMQISLIDKRTGNLVGDAIRIPRTGNSDMLNGDVGFWKDRLVVGTLGALLAIETAPLSDDAR